MKSQIASRRRPLTYPHSGRVAERTKATVLKTAGDASGRHGRSARGRDELGAARRAAERTKATVLKTVPAARAARRLRRQSGSFPRRRRSR
jgi:hypothetical protein